jgi:hypothetical protein
LIGECNTAAVDDGRSIDSERRRCTVTGREVFVSFPDLNEQAADAGGLSETSWRSRANFKINYRQPFAAVFVIASSTPDAQALAKL